MSPRQWWRRRGAERAETQQRRDWAARLLALHAGIPDGDEKSAAVLRKEALIWLHLGDPTVAARFVRAAREADPEYRLDMEHTHGPRWYQSPADDGWPGAQTVTDTPGEALVAQLRSAREKLCSAQVLLDDDQLSRIGLGQAIRHIDGVGTAVGLGWPSEYRDHTL